jgi:hypothetical protein
VAKKRKPCTKVAYATRGEAAAAIDAMFRRFPSIVFKKPYRCGACKAWHVTSTPRLGAGRRIKH